MNILDEILGLKDDDYKTFQEKLVPDNKYEVIGVRVPKLRELSKKIIKSNSQNEFLDALPHKYYDENILHSIILSQIKNYDELISRIESFLPYIDNWAVCDMISPKNLAKHTGDFYNHIQKWANSNRTYTVRFAVVMLLQFYLKEEFDIKHLKLVKDIKSEEYYVNMAKAWYYSMALVHQYDKTLPLIQEKSLDKFVQNKSIQKARESFRIDLETKDYLNTFKIQ